MHNEILYLGLFSAFILLCILIFRPSNGWFWRLKKRLRLSDGVLSEDILKYFAQCSLEGQLGTLKGASGATGIAQNKSGKLIEKLIERRFITVQGSGFKLSQDGLAYGLRLIRAHRLYETYMYEKSGFREKDWHKLANEAEHDLTINKINDLEKQLNFPIHDPHGDPIPDYDGTIKTYENKLALCDMQTNDTGVIVHIEDEPGNIYSKLADMGLCPGLKIRILENDSLTVLIWAIGKQHLLTKMQAANVHVIKKQLDTKQMEGSTQTLADYPVGKIAQIQRISPRISDSERRRLMDLGFLPGTSIEKELVNASGDPIAFRIRGTLLALRRSQANLIFVKDKPL